MANKVKPRIYDIKIGCSRSQNFVKIHRIAYERRDWMGRKTGCDSNTYTNPTQASLIRAQRAQLALVAQGK